MPNGGLKAQKEETEQNEARFRSLIEHVPDGILIVRETISYANPAAWSPCMALKESHGKTTIVDPPSLHIVSPDIIRENPSELLC